MDCNSLFLCNDFKLNTFVVIWSSTCRTEAVHVVLDVVEAELTDLVVI